MPMIFRRWFVAATLLTCLCHGWTGDAPVQGATQRNSEHEDMVRLAVIGASASAGFGIVVEIENEAATPDDPTVPRTVKRMIRLIDLIDAADQQDRIIEFDLSSHMFFTRPFEYGRSSVDRTLSWKPDVVFAVDFLFWYVFGNRPEETRLDSLREGLAELERLAKTGVSLVVGTVPDLEGIKSPMISEEQIARSETVTEANRRIKNWAKTHPNVMVAPIFELSRTLNEGGPIRIGRHQWDPDRDGLELIAPDKLHPTYEGLICIAQAIDVELRRLPTERERFPMLDLDRSRLMELMRVRPGVSQTP
ncbi:MAG TPA: hypothetical protein DCX60_05540 [Phycisphaerales bacterium]|nr:hypothetical protein [Phycisphaerales bacterium]